MGILPKYINHHHEGKVTMATKAVMTSQILAEEPSNEIALQKTVSHASLKSELAAVLRRKKVEALGKSIDAILHFRMEEGELMSWRIHASDDGRQMTNLEFGTELPMVGMIVSLDEETCAAIKEHRDDLEIKASDLPVREKFDERRIYTTPNGTNVVYMREERGRIVLWSYKVHTEIMIGGLVGLTRTPKISQPKAVKPRKMTQKLLASYLIANNPDISGKELTSALKKAFPAANIIEGGRHGPHYISLSRNGKLPMAPDTDPSSW